VRAQDFRLELELELNATAVDHEVVILEAESEAAIRRTHGRLRELIEKFKDSLLAA
jgi:two-component SAPR family response regulator